MLKILFLIEQNLRLKHVYQQQQQQQYIKLSTFMQYLKIKDFKILIDLNN